MLYGCTLAASCIQGVPAVIASFFFSLQTIGVRSRDERVIRLLRIMQPITLYSMRTQVESAARNALRWHVSFFLLLPQCTFLLTYGIYSKNFVLIVCFYSITGLSEESIYHTRKFSHATIVVMYFAETYISPPSYFFLFKLLFPNSNFFLFFYRRLRNIVKLRRRDLK